MIRTGVAKKKDKNGGAARSLLHNKFIMLLFVLFLLGMVYGAVSVQNMDKELIQSADFITQGFIDQRAEQSIIKTFISSFISSGIILSAVFVLGFSAIGQPVTFFVPVFRGLGLGFSMGYLYFYYGWTGAAYSAVLILPHVLVSTLAILLGCKESIRFSNRLFSQFKPNSEQTVDASYMKLYVSKFLALSLLILISALLDSVFTFLFARFFKL